MFDAILSKLRVASRSGGRPDRVSVLLPFALISIGLGVLAWRSYNLSVRTEEGAKKLAVQYARYASEITASRVDAAARAEMLAVSEEWQQLERRLADPTFAALKDWITQHEWLTSAMYEPDFDPASAIYAQEARGGGGGAKEVTREFFTASGSIKYTFDPRRLLAVPTVVAAIRQQPAVKSAGTLAIQPSADLSLVTRQPGGPRKLADGYSFVTPLSPPLDHFGIRSVVRTSYVEGTGWENQRTMSLWVSFLALVLLGIGATLALRGINKEAETMKLRGALIANVSHELRTPLAMIRLGAETLKRGKVKDKDRAEIEDQILREVLLLSHLVENVLDVARIQNDSTRALAFTPVHPRDLIRTLLTTYESWIRSKGFTTEVEIDDSVGEQMWDRDSVSRALLNLIDNAIKYSGDDKHIEVALRQDQDHVIIEVRDHGLGISTVDQARIFDPYFRAQFSDTISRRGAGLGLTLVQQIVASHGGKVEVQSEPGKGSTFRLLFPRELAGDAHGVAALGAPREAF
ncbi:MAG TPA: HAMP domain-containing sensor histidine kinase [Thermoanaerobaculia bacterium]|nr:HAMP domain-containing sensor histidine kinase [Thermoanaerobaculia bacterium]